MGGATAALLFPAGVPGPPAGAAIGPEPGPPPAAPPVELVASFLPNRQPLHRLINNASTTTTTTRVCNLTDILPFIQKVMQLSSLARVGN